MDWMLCFLVNVVSCGDKIVNGEGVISSDIVLVL